MPLEFLTYYQTTPKFGDSITNLSFKIHPYVNVEDNCSFVEKEKIDPLLNNRSRSIKKLIDRGTANISEVLYAKETTFLDWLVQLKQPLV